MNTIPPDTSSAAIYETLASRAMSLGVLVWEVSRNGMVVRTPANPQALADWGTSTTVRHRLYELVADARAQRPEGVEIWPGVHAWLLPDRLHGTAMRRFVAVALPPGFESEIETQGGMEQQQAVAAAISGLTRQAGLSMPQLHSVLRWTLDDLIEKGQLEQSVEQFSDKLAQSYEEVSLVFRIVRLMNSGSPPLKSLETVCAQMQEVLSFGWVALRFVPQSTALPDLTGELICSGRPPVDPDRMQELVENLVGSWNQGGSECVLTPPSHELARISGAEVVARPITHDDHVVGAILAGNKHGEDTDISSDELQFLEAAADFLGMYHENLSRFHEQADMFMGTLRSLTAAIDAKDPYTCGHSERVALLARAFATALGMNDRDAETYYVVGLVHDVGKIGVPEAVLCKCGKLDAAEFGWIKRHSEIGHRILKDIPAMEVILPGVLHHHERWDGGGYPHGLAGEQIPLAARVVAIADTFDAMSSNRSYRAALPRERIVAEIRKCAGTQFDPSLVETFLGMDFSEFYETLNAAAARAAA